jgi:hypothetical protein
LDLNSAVRIIRQPYFGVLGTVQSLPSEPTKIPTEALARVAEIRLADGKQLMIPRTNLERIEE